MKNVASYPISSVPSSSRRVQFLFESKGKQSIIKAIEYSPVFARGGRVVYNLGFGDYDEENRCILDDVNSNNEDMYKVFSTVLHSIPQFFKSVKNSAIWVQGSDSQNDYKEKCKKSCKKKCHSECKNLNRRIKTYRYFVDKNFQELIKSYIIFGLPEIDGSLVQYLPNNEYVGIMIYPRN